MKYIAFIFILCITSLGLSYTAVAVDSSVGIQMRPLLYEEKLEPNQIKKGYLDISNPSSRSVILLTSVQLFTQIDDQGSLRFYDADYIREAIVPEFDEFELGPKEALRLFFTGDSSKLPDGDVLAAIFVKNKTTPQPLAMTPAVRVGTLLIFENGKPGPRDVAITELSVPHFTIGDKIEGRVVIKNTAPENIQSGFFADVHIQVAPWGSEVDVKSPLITSGKTREFEFSVDSNQLGLYWVKVTANGVVAEKPVLLVTGIWRWVLMIVGITLAVSVIVGVIVLPRKRGNIRLR